MSVVASSFCRSVFGVLALVCLCLPGQVWALGANVEVETLLRGFERTIPGKGDDLVMPGYAYLRFDLKNVTNSDVSFHGYGWGRYDLADSDYFTDTSESELLYGYFEYRKKFSSLKVRLGRMQVFEGVGNEVVDGLWAGGKISEKVSLAGYFGQAAGLASENGRDGDSIVGGRLGYLGGDYSLGLSAKVAENDGETADQMFGVDLVYYLPKDMTLYGYSKFNAEESDFAEHSWELIVPLDSLSLRPFLQYYDYDSYFGTGDSAANPGVGDKARLPFRNLAKSGETLMILGAEADWRKSDSLTLGGKLKSYSYDQNDGSLYAAVTAITRADEGRTQTGGELGYMSGDAANNDFLLLRLYTYRDEVPDLLGKLSLEFLSADLVYALYDKKINGEDSSLFLSLGVGRHLLDEALDIKLSGDYSSDPYYSSDVRGMLSATYYFGRRQ